MTTAPRPPSAGRAALQASLGFTRERVLTAVEGLPDEVMRRAVLPSGWTPVGLLSHLTHDVERFWFGAVTAAQPEVIAGLGDADGWHPPAELAVQEVVQQYRRACAQSDEIIAATALDTPPGWWPDEQFGEWRLADLHAVVLHVIVETATHLGHLDVVRELIDGTQWLVLT